ncbi:NADPH-dependent F420 reductase [Planosporangium thailandense]|uniref:NADPH-dependent F420 reductase n=1 Tax=Planosporangium thailandense TaxID=765197 RepID=UPI0030B83BF4
MDVHTIGVIGGTGPQGRGLAYRFALGGHDVILGSRSRTRATEAADDLNGLLGASAVVRGGGNREAIEASDVVLLAVPYDGHRELLEELRPALAGKVVISCVNPLGFDRAGPYGLAVPEGSAAEQAAAVLPDSTVVAAFHHVAAATLLKTVDHDEHEDVLVCGDDAGAKEIVIKLASTVSGRPGVDAGPLRMARYLEPLTAVLIAVNKRYKTRSGIAVTGLRERG